ncbi:hypothetical protein IH574_01375 [Candidatus Bathyarchaeota archaeon]|nr:hypothetical protein [Candidatus Bathyarchaeota archaeon]
MTVEALPKDQTLRELLTGNVLVLTVSRILWSMSDALVLSYLSLYILALGGDKPTIGWVKALGSFAALLLYPIGGYSSGFLVFIPMTIGSIFSGYIYDYNAALPWILQAVFLSVGLVLTFIWLKDPEKKQV